MKDDGTMLSWRLLATGTAVVLWSILAYVGTAIQTDVREIKQALAAQSQQIAISSQRLEIHASELTTLKQEHKDVRRDVDQIRERLTIWQRLYNWRTP